MARQPQRFVGPTIMFAALGAGIVSALGILLVPGIARAFDVEIATAQWMLTVNLLSGVVVTPIMGRLSDRPRARRVLLVSLAVIGIGSVLCALAPSFEILLVGRALQGPSYGLFPVAASLVRRRLSGTALRSSLSGLAISGAIGTGLGYPITGILAEIGSFRLAFWFGAVYMTVAIVTVWRTLLGEPSDGARPRHRFDAWGALLLGAGMAPLLFWIAEGPRIGWVSPLSFVLVTSSVLLLAGWVLQALRAKYPLIDVRSLARPDVILANFVAVSFGMTMYMVASGSGIVGQAPTETGYGYGWGVGLAGLIMLPLTVGAYLSNRLSVGRLHSEKAVLWALPVGAATAVLASALLVFLHWNPVAFYAGMFLAGVGMGIAYAALPLLVARSVDAADLGSAMSFNQLLRTVGGSLGSAISGGIFAAFLFGHAFPSGLGVMVNFAVPGILAAMAGILLLAVALRRQ